MKKEPDLSDLVKIFQGHEHQYMEIGDYLKVPCRDLQASPQSSSDKLITVFQRWRDRNEEVTWEEIAEMCQNLSFSSIRVKALKFLSSEVAHNKYLGKPDHNKGSSGTILL